MVENMFDEISVITVMVGKPADRFFSRVFEVCCSPSSRLSRYHHFHKKRVKQCACARYSPDGLIPHGCPKDVDDCSGPLVRSSRI
jgi:hypothetical protein